MNKYKWQIDNKVVLEKDTNTSFNINVESEYSARFNQYINNGGLVDSKELPNLLSQNIFTKLQIRRAMRALGNENILDLLLTNETFYKDWNDAIEIDLNDTMTKQALESVNIDINIIKKQILGII